VDLRRCKRTVQERVWFIRKFLESMGKKACEVNREDVRGYLRDFSARASSSYYANMVKSLRVFFRDYLQKPDVVSTFKLPKVALTPKNVPTRTDLLVFYEALGSLKEKALFLAYASSGLRRMEVLGLTFEDVDFEKRMITPKAHSGETKKSWISFYNKETQKVLKKYLAERTSGSRKLFPMASLENHSLWRDARQKTGLNITPQRLREWFCVEMSMKGVSSQYVDAFCGRTPRSVLARSYSDYSAERLKEIYDKANLKAIGVWSAD